MPTFNVTQIYFGIFNDFDPNESTPADPNNFANELASVPGWTSGQVFDFNSMQLTGITQNDTIQQGNTNRLEENDFENRPTDPLTADSYTYDLGSGAITSNIDSTFTWNIIVTLADNSTVSLEASFVQLENGAIFTNSPGLGGLSIKSIELDTYNRGNYFGVTPNRTLTGTTIVCFTTGTMIRTDSGDVAIEDLGVGDLVMTKDHGLQPIRWIGSQKVSGARLEAYPNLRPIRICRGALGDNVPSQDLVVSPQHRILVRSKIAQRMFGSNEVLVAAKHLCEIQGIDIAGDLPNVEYFHMLFDRHEIVLSNDAETESLHTGPMALQSVSPAARMEILDIFPELAFPNYERASIRQLVSGRMGRQLAMRHSKNHQSLYN